MPPLDARAGRWLAVGLLALAASLGCNRREPVLDTPAFSPSGPSPVVPGLMLSFEPPAVMAGAGSQGIVSLSRAAPAGGLVVSLQSGSSAVSVPPSVTVPAGSPSVVFPVRTTGVASDVTGLVSASGAGEGARGALVVWAVLPTYISMVGGPGSRVGQGGFRRFTPDTFQITGNCTESRVQVNVAGPDFWTLTFGAPTGTPLRPGVYEGTSRAGLDGMPRMDAASCGFSTGRFVVHDVLVGRTGNVERFWATFEEYCSLNTVPTRGEIRVTALTRIGASTSTCIVP